MARYTIRNISGGRIQLPHPIDRPMDRESVIVVDVPAHLMEQFNYKFNQHHIKGMLKSRLITVSSDIDPETPETIQVPTIQIVRTLIASSGGGSFKFGQTIYSGAPVPPGTNLPGGGFFDFTQVGLIFFNLSPDLQNCRVFLNGVVQVNGDSFTPFDVKLGSSPSLGDLVFTNINTTIRSGDVISVEAHL